MSDLRVVIADKASDPAALADLFRRNLSTEYISHSEIQGRRALTSSKWAPDIQLVLQQEIEARLKGPLIELPSEGNWAGILVAHLDSELIGLAFITLVRDVPRSFGVIEDIIIDQSYRGRGFGREFLGAVLQMLKHANLVRAFLESGKDNHGAHHVFEQLGFHEVSIVMLREL